MPSFSPQVAAGSSDVGELRGVGVAHWLSDTTTSSQRSSAARVAARSGRLTTGLVAMIHNGAHPALADRAEQVQRLEPGRAGHARRVPEALQPRTVLRAVVHVRGELGGEPADLAPAHGVGLPGKRERSGTGSRDAAGGEMAVDDGVDLVGPAGGLVDALREQGERALGAREPVKKFPDGIRLQPAGGRHFGNGVRAAPRHIQRGGVALHMLLQIEPVERILAAQVRQQAVEQHTVRPRAQRQVQVGEIAARGAPRIDHHHPQLRSALARGAQALEQHGMAPRGIGTGQHHQVGQIDVFVAARHGIAAERPLVAGDGRGHAQTRVGVDVGAADVALHELVGDVVILGEQLPRNIEGDRVRAVAFDHAAKALGNGVQRAVPVHLAAVHARPQQSPLGAQGLGERGALGAQSAAVRGMIRIAAHAVATAGRRLRQHAAAHATVGTGRGDRRARAHTRRLNRPAPPTTQVPPPCPLPAGRAAPARPPAAPGRSGYTRRRARARSPAPGR